RLMEFILSSLVFSVVATGERPLRSALAFEEKCGVRTAVVAARQIYAHGNIADLAEPNRGAQLAQEALRDLLLGHANQRFGVVPNIPIAMLSDVPSVADAQPRSSRDLGDSREQSIGGRCG